MDVRRELRKWRKRGRDGEMYKKSKREYEDLCEEKKKENEEWERKAMEAKKENEVWEINNRNRKRRRVNEGIEMGSWKEYFAMLLEGVDERVLRRKRRDRGTEEEEEKIGWGEIKGAIRKLKRGKATGIDGILKEM